VYPAHDPRVSARFITVNKLRLRVIEAGSPDAPTVVCVPGWACSAYEYRENIPALARAGLRAIAVELPGQGESDKPRRPDLYTLPELASALSATLDTLGIGRSALVGQSLGAAIAATFTRRARHRVSRLALLAPVGFGSVRLAAAVRRLVPISFAPVLDRLAYRIWWRLGLRLAYGKRGRPTDRDVEEYFAPTRDPAFLPSLLALMHHVDWSLLDDRALASIDLPVLVVCGSADRLIRCVQVAERAKRLPNARTVVIPGAGHALQEETPDEVNRALVDFLVP
jgi:pimeloyl-ACP methyl ester carboxylesterase